MSELSLAMLRADASGGIAGPFIGQIPFRSSGGGGTEPTKAKAVSAGADSVLRKAESAHADAMSVVMRAARRGGQPDGVVRRLEAEAVTAIHAILCGVQDAPVQAVVNAEAAE